jgi:spore coat protein A, manganese oxidase
LRQLFSGRLPGQDCALICPHPDGEPDFCAADPGDPEYLLRVKKAIVLSRRRFMRQGSAAAALGMLPGTLARASFANMRGGPAMQHGAAPAPSTLDPGTLKRFVDPLPIPQLARAIGDRPSPENRAEKLPFYRMAMSEFESRVHRDLKPTRQWGFNGTSPGPTIEVRAGKGVLVEWANQLPKQHIFTIDHTLHGAERSKPEVRSVVHLHGAKAPPESDGYPEEWFVPGKSAVCHYPNGQDACMLWYHDHAMGINRLNIYAGMFGLYLIRDEAEDALSLPGGEHEIPLVLCDRAFAPDAQLSYQVSPDPNAPWMPEVYGNVTMVNGKLFPFLEVEPTLYRLRVVNVANSQFYNLSLSNGQPIMQIGADQGLLPAPVSVKIVTLAPAERADLLVDFSGRGGEQIVLNTERIQGVMQFRVRRGAGVKSSIPAKLRPVAPIPESAAVRTRQLTLNEYKTPKGDSMLMLLNATHWDMPITENPTLDTVEIWSLVNLTEDVHPIHLHLVRFQILDRRPFDNFDFFRTGKLRYLGDAQPPDPGEAGWKDTVRADPQMVTRIIVRFEGYAGRYVWHCHILEHEDNEMMRPYEVLPAKA